MASVIDLIGICYWVPQKSCKYKNIENSKSNFKTAQ